MTDSPALRLPESAQSDARREVMARYREIEAALTAPGADFEVVDVADRHHTVRTYRHVSASLHDMIAELVERNPDAVLARDADGTSRTYREVFDDSAHLAAALEARHGVGPGDRVGIAMANHPDCLVVLFAITRLAATAVLYNSRGSATDFEAALEDVPCRVVLADGRRAAMLHAIAPALDVVATARVPELPEVQSVAQLIADSSGPTDPKPAGTADICLILFTSGTSGRAKGVMLSNRNLVNVLMNMRFVAETNLEFAARTYGMSVADLRAFMPTMSALLIYPLFHVSGIAALLSAMNSGGFVATMPRWDAERAAELIASHKITLMAGPPMTIDDLLSLPGAADSLATLVNIAPGGQATPPNVAHRIADRLPSARRSAGWGMTEVGGSVCTAGGDILALFPETSGPPSPTMDVRVVDADGRVLSVDEVGELQLSGGLVMAGYFGADAPEDDADTVESWFPTGDLGYLDEFGLVYVVDRMKDLVISAGENISCVEVESALATSDRFAEIAAFGVPDDRLGERLVVAVVPRPGTGSLTESAVQQIAADRLPKHKIPQEVLIEAGPLPRNATGKLLKRELRRRYLDAAAEATKGGVR
ncbi:class I adenylate-forming enzyme family protein [Rhodococcus gannanensis]|uniref:Class I adenylate-forming enzyme family protein n=1 Tax=Rhodococcus gannanensis TaxID=1960308 RepID=A0ABW4PB06_9NOCA